MGKYKFGIVGVGPVGGIMGAHLAKAGHDVALIDIMKAHMDEIKKSGLSVTGFKDITASFPKNNICYGIDEMNDKNIDYLFISVKASILPQILPILKTVVKPGMTFIVLQNGLDNEDLVADAFGKENTLRIVVNYAGNLIDNGKVRMSFFNAPNHIGMLDPAAEKKAKELAEVITAADLETAFTPEIKKFEWEKIILNAALSPVCALARRTMKQMMEFEYTRDLAESILREGIEVAAANGVHFKPDFLEFCMSYLDKAGHHRTSMHVDIEKKNPTEIGFINEKIVTYGKKKGIPTPINSTIVSLIKGSELPEYIGA
ncbi:MAG: 2-dehydropantoate 2-reductase [Thermoplasmatales archaeon]|nr:MAG: 2-dehydropantoate 2-reductase [Thermoplasmatales archaeon]